ncbi:MAG: NADH-quinone oxidoreductase subunit [Thermoproteota archaeon]|nr:NADH-quinone oxidoreductase subunit [Thermoproteota archaeon]
MKPDELSVIAERESELRKSFTNRINICCSSGCANLGALKVLKAFEDAVKDLGFEKKCKVARTGCLGTCYVGPAVLIEPGDYIYMGVTPEAARQIVNEHIVNGRPVKNFLYASEEYFHKQNRLVMKKAGNIDPLRIEDYIAFGGYSALLKVLTSMTPTEVIANVATSGLRGRGGAGFPTGLKWSLVANAIGTPKYVVANLDEGDPGVFANRTLAEADPNTIIEGITIGAYAVGAELGYIYIRGEYPLGVQTLRKTLDNARSMGFLGKNIFGTPFNFDLELRLGAGAFVAGEETAILASIEGHRATPHPRPPYPANAGLWGKPTLINNVETFGNIPMIILNGGSWFSKIGKEGCTGTKCFSLTGKVKNPGLIEVPMGITLREVVFNIGNGMLEDGKFKAVLAGGPSGGCLPESLLDLSVDYDSLTKAGAIMGSGGIVVIDDKSCMVDTAKFFITFCMEESCGKCTPCRIGLVKVHGILEKITRGEGTLEDLVLLEDMSNFIREGSLCGLGQTAPNPVLTTLRYFRDEYISHIVSKKCPAEKCFREQEKEATET